MVVAPIITERVVVGARKLVLEISKVLPKPALPLSSDSQPKVPPAQVKTLFVSQVARPAPLKRAV